MNKMRLLLIIIFCVVFAESAMTQEPVLIGQYTDPSYIDAASYGGMEGIYFDPVNNYIATGVQLDRTTINAIISLDGGVTWTTTTGINNGGEVRHFSVTGDANTPIYLTHKRNDGDPSATPWARHRSYICTDDFGWGGGAFSATAVATAGTETDVLDSYAGNMDISSFDPNLRGVITHHGSSQPGGEYQQFFYSVDGGATWSDRIRLVSSADEDSLNPNFVDDLTYNVADFEYGPDGYILATGTAQWDFDFQGAEHLWYAVSTDSGKTWGPVQIIPGSEYIDVSWSVVDRGWNLLLDANNNFHLFVLAIDATSIWGAYDFIWNGTEWSMKRFVEPQLIDNGLVAIERDENDYAPLNAPTLNSDGTIFYSFLDVADTTGGVNDYRLYTVYSQDGGATWSDRVELIGDPDFNAEEFVDVARAADGDLHVIYCKVDTAGGVTVNQYYQKFPISEIISVESSPIIINEFMFDVTKDDPATPDVNEGDINGDGQRSIRGDEFIEIYNSGDAAVDISGYEFLKRDLTVFFTFPENTILEPGEFAVVFGGVGPEGFGSHFPPELKLFAAVPGDGDAGFAGDDGTSNLQNSRDNIILVNPAMQDTIAEYYWGSATAMTSVGVKLEAPNTVNDQEISGSIHQSVVRNPDFTGLWDLHTQASANGYYQSPGNVTDSPFTGVSDKDKPSIPSEHTLYQNYPNPFNPATTIRFSLSKPARVTVTIYNVNGEQIARLADNQLFTVGIQELKWNAADVASGVYFYHLETNDGYHLSHKMVLLK